jgi:hypothetical protein
MATILEYDDAYRMPILDSLSEFTKEEVLKSPKKFIKKFFQIIKERSDNDWLISKYERFSTLAGLILLIPKYRRAFNKAFEQVNFDYFKYDDYDHYWSLNRKGYDARGRSLSERMTESRVRFADYNCYCVHHDYKAGLMQPDVAKQLIQNIIASNLEGVKVSDFYTDEDREFTNKEIKELAKKYEIQ